MKKKLKIIVFALFICVFGYFGFQIYTKINHKKQVAENIKTIPKFQFKDTNNAVFSNKNLQPNTPTLFVYYNSECDFCNEETAMIQSEIEKFGTTQIIFISFEKPNKIQEFSKKHKLDTYDNVHFLRDSKITFATTFDVKSLPCLVLYDKNQKLIEKIKGQTKIETLLEKLRIK
jgi:peroxiredoxin